LKIYLDTGVFIDYLSPLILGGINLRPTNRRGRTPAQLSQDAESVLKKIASSHLAATSSLTYYEVEEALFKQFTSVTIGMENASNFRVLAARSIVVQTFNVVRFFGITALDLTSTILELQLNCLELQMRGIRAADALHVATAIHFNAEVFISVDEDLLKLNTLITNNQGNAINFCDTDTALLLI